MAPLTEMYVLLSGSPSMLHVALIAPPVYVCVCLHLNSAGFGECLLDPPTSTKYIMKAKYPRQAGEVYNADTQCALVFGIESKRCPYMVSTSVSIWLPMCNCVNV